MLHSTATDSLFSLLFALCNLQMKGFTAVFFSGFYPPKSRVKIGLIPPSWSFLSLPHFHQLPSKNNLGQNAVQMSKCTMRIDVTTTGKVSNKFVLHRIQRKQWNIGVKKISTINISPLFFTGRRLSPPCIGIEVPGILYVIVDWFGFCIL